MKEEIGKQLAQEALSILRGTKAFVLAEAPDFMRQVLAWKMAETIVVFAIGIVLVISGTMTLRYIWTNWDRVKRNDAEPLAVIALMVQYVLGIVCFFGGALDAIKIHYAPKLFLLEYFAGLVK